MGRSRRDGTGTGLAAILPGANRQPRVLAAPLNILYESAMSQILPSATPPGPAGISGLSGPCQDGGAPPGPASERALAQLEAVARELEGQPEALLSLLRNLEQLHRSIQDGPFRSSLPADRNALFRLLSEMERSGGWPYIPRLQLRTFLDLLGQGGAAEDPSEEGEDPRQGLDTAPRLAA